MNRRLILLAIIPGILGILILVFLFKSADDGSAELSETEMRVRNTNQCNADLNAAVLAVRLGLVLDYDELTECENQIALACGSQSASVASPNSDDAKWHVVKELAKTKVALVGEFKTRHSVIRNATAGFQHHVRRASQMSKGDPLHAVGLAQLECVGTRFIISGLANDRKELERAINSWAEQMQTEAADDPAHNRSLQLALRHGQVLLDYSTHLDNTLKQLLQVPIRETTRGILDSATESYTFKRQTAWVYRGLLLIFSLAMIFFCALQYIQALKQREAFRLVNLQLDEKVEERTSELSRANELLEKKTQEAQTMALVARYTHSGVIITDKQGCVDWTNEGYSRISGNRFEDVVGKPISELFNPDTSCPETVAKVQESFAKGSSFEIVAKNKRKTGSEYWVEIEGHPILDSDGEIQNFMMCGKDITGRIEADERNQILQQELLDASRHAGMAEIATGVLHNVGNILNSVNVSASMIRKTFETSAFDRLQRVSELIGEHESNFEDFVANDKRGRLLPAFMQKATAALGKERDEIGAEFDDLLNNVEHIKQIVSAQQSMAKSSGLLQELDPAELIRDALAANRGSLHGKNIQIEKAIPADVPTLVSDKHKILQILVNLVKNAQDAIVENSVANEQTGMIKIEVASEDDWIKFSVVDNGTGIASDHLERIFQHGFTTKKSGHGFGLHCSANAAVELGGSLTAQSEGKGKGTTFILQLPLKQEKAKSKQRATAH